MAAATFTPYIGVATTTLTAVLTVASAQEWNVDVRVSIASGTADDVYDLVLQAPDGTTQTYRARAHPVAYGGGTYDIEKGLTVPAGYKLLHRSGAGVVGVTMTGRKRTA